MDTRSRNGRTTAARLPAAPVVSPVTALVLALIATVAVSAALLSGCDERRPSATMDREMLDTVVTVTAYGEDPVELDAAIEAAFAQMERVQSLLDAYDPDSVLAGINRDPYGRIPLPSDAIEIEDTVRSLGVRSWFDPLLGGVTSLYDFGGVGRVPDEATLQAALDARSGMLLSAEGHYRHSDTGTTTPSATATATATDSVPPPRLDYSGALKGLALDRAAEVLQGAAPGVSGALITAGSTTVAVGSKPDGSVWRIGIEDPRATGTVVAVVSSEEGPLSVATSGDYQRHFERDGIRYHHILDPSDGRPARGVRSVSVAVGPGSGPLEADILSTALFVMDVEDALTYSEEHGILAYIVDDEGRVHIAPGLEDSPITLEERAQPIR